VGEFGLSRGNGVWIAKGIMKNPNDILSIAQANGFPFYEWEDLGLGSAL